MADMNPEHPVLLVDDEKPLLDSLRFSLKSTGINHINTCSESTEVTGLLEKNRYSLIVLDNMMPKLSGMELLPLITKDYPDIPVIMLTAVQETDVIVKAMKSGAFDYLVKPVNKNLLVKQVERALDFSEMHRKNKDLNTSLQKAIKELEIKTQTQEDLLGKITKSTYQLRSILNAFPAITILVDNEGNVAQCNDKVKDYFNFDYSDIVLHPFDSFLEKIIPHFEDEQKFKDVVNRLQTRITDTIKNHDNYSFDHETRVYLNNKAKTPLEIISFPVYPHDGKKLGSVWVFRDMTYIIEAEEQLQTVVNASPVPLLISRVEDGRFLYANTQLADMIGIPMTEILEKTTREFYYDPSERDIIVQLLKENKKVANHELKIRRTDGTFIWAVLNLAFSHLNGQDVIVGGVSDISEQKNAIETLEKTKKTLMETQTRLVQSEKMASLGNLVAGIAHEINNPVGAVSSSADAAKRAVAKIISCINPEGSPDGEIKDKKTKKIFDIIKDCHNIISDGCSRISDIVRNLKNFSRIDEAEYLAADVHEGLDSTLALVNHQYKNRIEIIKNYADLPLVDCYPNQLNQVFMNMLVNAGQAITDKGTVTIETAKENSSVLIRIKDTGKGIPEDKLSKVFDPGYTTKGVGVGTGLGLSISYNILEKHKGSIDVESEVGKGTTFTIKLPLK